jgi:hypothetical protein
MEIRARRASPGGAAKRGMSAISCLLPSLVTRASDCLDCPVDEPDEERATALVLNAKERMDTPPGECKLRVGLRRTLPSVQRERNLLMSEKSQNIVAES